MSGIKYWVWLGCLRGLKNQTRLALLRHFGTPEDIFFADEGELMLVEGMDREQLRIILSGHSMKTADHVLGECQRLGIRLMTIQDADYPGRLRDIYDPPCLLYIRGHLPVIDEKAVITIVGTRSCTPYGIACAERISYGLTTAGMIVASGLALGIDSAASRGALMAGGITIGLLGCGLDMVYPKENWALYEDVAAAGALISEYPPGTDPLPGNFPVRNRIMSGISVGALVVEAPVRSGSLITAGLALEQGRDVFAVPGPVDAPASQGCNRLIREGAILVTCAGDILEEYASRFPLDGREIRNLPAVLEEPVPKDAPERMSKNIPERMPKNMPKRASKGVRERKPEEMPKGALKGVPESAGTAPQTAQAVQPLRTVSLHGSGLTDDQMAILPLLNPDTPVLSDDLIDRSGIPTQRILSALTVLEVDGLIRQHGGKRYTRLVNLAE